MDLGVPRKKARRRQTNLLVKLRAKMVTIVYKTDLLVVFFFVLVFGMLFHYLAWIYQPPDLMNLEVSYSKQQALIREWKRKKLEEEAEERLRISNEQADVFDSHVNEFAPGLDNGAVQGPYSRRSEKIFGDVLNFDEQNLNRDQGFDLRQLPSDLSHREIHDLPLAGRQLKRTIRKEFVADLAVDIQEQKRIYESVREKLREGELTLRSGEETRDGNSQFVVRKSMNDLKIGSESKLNRSSINELKRKNKKRYRFLNLTTPRSDTELQRVFANRHPANELKANRTAIDKLIENIDHESEHFIGMESNEKDKWLDDQAETLYRLMFHKEQRPVIIQQSDFNISAPIGGNLKGGPAQCRPYDLTEKSNETFECMPLAIKPKVNICLYPSELDIHISKHIREHGVWEPHIVKEFQNILFTNPDYGVIDIGANIGVYSLIAATMGHQVVAVEPYINNLKHFHKAVEIGGLADKITLLRNVVYDKRLDDVSLALSKQNQGGIVIDPGLKDPCPTATCTAAAKSIYMDDLLEVINFKKAVMKIDIEGFEHRAFAQSSRLFDQVFISHIIMEWIIMRGYYGAEIDSSDDKTLVFRLVDMLFDRGFRPFSLVTNIELKRHYWYAWPDDIIWRNDLEEFN